METHDANPIYGTGNGGVGANNIVELPVVTPFKSQKLTAQEQAVADWKMRFRSFRSGALALARKTAENADGRKTLEAALGDYVSEFSDGYVDEDEVEFFARQLATCWPRKASKPVLPSPKNDAQKTVVALLAQAFSIVPQSNGDTPRRASR